MELSDLIGYFVSFVFGGAVGSLITLNVSSRKAKQSKISVGNGDVVAGDKNG